ncbi:MAG: DnaD domain protein, partial [Oscillospiraceae bacterium]|nr:DnaD domain protein [Oscillospiraceae bacterium]
IEIEKEIEKENELEIEEEYEEEKEKEIKSLPVLPAEVKAEDVFSFYLDKFNAAPSPLSLEKLKAYCKSLSPAVVLHALHIACDDKKFSFSYIEAILQRYSREGLNTLALVQEAEQQRADKKAWEAVQPERHKSAKLFGGTDKPELQTLEELDAILGRI